MDRHDGGVSASRRCRCVVDGRPLQLGGTRQRSVLTLLLLQRNRPVATASVADRLWPDEQPLTAIKTVQVYVSRLRHIFGSEADRITSHSTGYRLTAADDELDAARFEGGLRLAREAVASGSTDASVAMLETALAAWSGPALGDLGDEPFARHEALRLEELRLQAIEELCELRIDVGLGRDVITELRRHVGEHPGRERLWGLLMLALYGDGRQGEALQAYQDARRYLANELGLDPGPDLQALEGAILTQDASRPRQVTVPTGPRLRRDRRVVTVLRAERVHARDEDTLDPEVLESIGRRTVDVVRRAVERHGGTIDLADPNGVTAVFGLLVAREDDALRAVRAASELAASPGSTGDPDPLLFRVSLATGEVLAVAHGSDRSGRIGCAGPRSVAPRRPGRARRRRHGPGDRTAGSFDGVD